jgi:hypothetical protein
MKTSQICACLGMLTLFGLQGSAASVGGPAEAMLEKARRSVSRQRNVTEVKSLAVDGRRLWEGAQTVQVGFRLVPPDRYQSRTGTVHHTLAGDRFWQSRRTSAEAERAARENTLNRFIRHSVVYLLSIPPGAGLRISHEGTVARGARTLDAVQVSGPHGPVLTLLLDRETARPAGYTYRATMQSAGGGKPAEVDAEVMILEYRQVDGVEFPVQLEETIDRARSRIVVDTIVVNASLTLD